MCELLFLLHDVVTTLKTAGEAIISALWRLDVHGAYMARLFFDATELENFW